MNYRSSSEIVKAERYMLDNLDVILPFIYGSGLIRPIYMPYDDIVLLDSTNKELILSFGDWVVLTEQGKFSIVKDLAFRKQYKPFKADHED